MINNPQELNQFVLKYGKYPSGLITLLPHFKNFWSGDALIRFVENDHIVWGAHGPLNGDTKTVSDFFDFAHKEKKLAILSPTDEVLANELKQKKFYLTPIGVTPHFDLKDYFEKFDPVNLLPLARSLKRKGAKVQCIKGDACTPELKEIFTRLIKDWEESKTLSFLCRTKPLENFDNKFFLYLMDKEEVTALVTALPYDKNKIYLCDYIRQPHSRAGSIEYTLIEGMRELHSLGFVEASLGLCPLADIKRPWFAKFIFKYNLFYNFQGLYHFKKKLRPTRFETQYLITQNKISISDYKNIAELILDQKLISLFKQKLNEIFSLRDQLTTVKNNNSFISRISLTLIFSLLFIILHYLRLYSPQLETIFSQSAYRPADVTNLGFWLSPLFHNHQFHLWGDQLSFLIFGCTLEYLTGKRVTFIIIAVGLWLSNPIAVMILKPILQFFPEALNFLMKEADYGSSNAVYALAGAFAGILNKRKWLLTPFIFNAVLFLFLKESLLALHHLVGLFMGLGITLFFLPIPRYKFFDSLKFKTN